MHRSCYRKFRAPTIYVVNNWEQSGLNYQLFHLFFIFKENSYLVKWEGYDLLSCTWEPTVHLPRHVKYAYLSPPISNNRLLVTADILEKAVKSRLKSRSERFSIDFPGDVYRYVFSTDKEVILDRDDFARLPLSHHWYNDLKKNGDDTRLCFPMRVKWRLLKRSIHIVEDDKLVHKHTYSERLSFVCASESCSSDSGVNS